MSRPGKALLIAFAVVAGLVVNTTLLAGIAVYRVYRAGTATITVQEKAPDGAHLRIPIPLGLVRTVLHAVPRTELPELDPEARRYLPVARRAALELAQAPDGVLVEVREDDEHVVIAKRDGYLVIEVDSAAEHVRVSLPADALDGILEDVSSLPVRIEKTSPGSVI